MNACTGNDGYEIAKLLLEYGADVSAKYKGNSEGKGKGYTALLYAAGSGDEKLIKLLVDYGAEINYQAEDGVNALMLACTYENISHVKFLLENGADVNAVDMQGKNALAHTIDTYFTPDYSIIEYLLQNGADTSIKTSKGKSMIALLNDNKKRISEDNYNRIYVLIKEYS